MSTEKGILTGTLEKKLAVELDNAIKLTGVLEAVDGLAFGLVISAIDNNLADKIPDPYKGKVSELLTEILEEKDYQHASMLAAEFVDALVDIPGLDDNTEQMIFTGIFTVVAGLLAKSGAK